MRGVCPPAPRGAAAERKSRAGLRGPRLRERTEDDKKDILLYNDNMRGVFKRMRPGGFSNGDVKPVCRLDNRGGDGVIFGGGGIGRLIACRRD